MSVSDHERGVVIVVDGNHAGIFLGHFFLIIFFNMQNKCVISYCCVLVLVEKKKNTPFVCVLRSTKGMINDKHANPLHSEEFL